MKGQANFGNQDEGGAQPKRGAIAQGAGQAKVAGSADIRAYATQTGMSYNDAAHAFIQAGYKVQQ